MHGFDKAVKTQKFETGVELTFLGKMLICMCVAVGYSLRVRASLGGPSANPTKSNQISCACVYIVLKQFVPLSARWLETLGK